jgi:hypothetical protein
VEGGRGGEASTGIGKLTALHKRDGQSTWKRFLLHVYRIGPIGRCQLPILRIQVDSTGFLEESKVQIEVIRRWDRMVALMVWK